MIPAPERVLAISVGVLTLFLFAFVIWVASVDWQHTWRYATAAQRRAVMWAGRVAYVAVLLMVARI